MQDGGSSSNSASLMKHRSITSSACRRWSKRVSAHKPDTRFDHADFKSSGESALQFEVVCYVPSPCTWTPQQAMNLALRWRFREPGIAFARPIRTLYVAPNGRQAPGDASESPQCSIAGLSAK
jgi:small-conductance mechanosensitive channel